MGPFLFEVPMLDLEIISPPTKTGIDLVTVEEAKLAGRIVDDGLDAEIESAIKGSAM